MIYLRLDEDRNEEIDRGASRSKQRQARKFRYSSEIWLQYRNFATIAKFRYNRENFATIAISLHNEFLRL